MPTQREIAIRAREWMAAQTTEPKERAELLIEDDDKRLDELIDSAIAHRKRKAAEKQAQNSETAD